MLVARPFILPVRLREAVLGRVAAFRWPGGRMVAARLSTRKSRRLRALCGVLPGVAERQMIKGRLSDGKPPFKRRLSGAVED